jgi:outer membrane usher protein
MTISLPFDGDKLISGNSQNQLDNRQTNIQLTKNLPFGEGYGYHMLASDNRDLPAQADFALQRDYGLFTARYSNFNQNNNYELNARGSLVHFAHHTFAARYVEQSFALVEVPGFKNVDVYSRNQLIGKTNSKGYLYIPETLPYQINEIEIDARSLPFNTTIPFTKMAVVPYLKSGALARFNISRIQNVLLTLNRDSGSPIPPGAQVYLEKNKDPLPVGYNGQVFISDALHTAISGRALWLNHRCYFKITLPTSPLAIIKETAICSEH